MQIVLKNSKKNTSKLVSRTQQKFKSERHNAFTEVINKIALSSKDDKRMQPIDSTETMHIE